MKIKLSKKDLPQFLWELESQYKDRSFLATDPIYFVHQYQDPRDQEVVALISALLAFGQVKAIHQSVEKVLRVLGDSPFQTLIHFSEKEMRGRCQGLGHRWVRGDDLFYLFCVLKKILLEHHSLKIFFMSLYKKDDNHIGALLARFSETMRHFSREFPKTRGYTYFFPHPKDGSPCKRMVLFMRWMVRSKDGMDLGLWSEIPASKLLMPLDLHVYRFGRRFRLSRQKNPNWRFAEDVTSYLRCLDASDPVRFDFPICHYGMENGWM